MILYSSSSRPQPDRGTPFVSGSQASSSVSLSGSTATAAQHGGGRPSNGARPFVLVPVVVPHRVRSRQPSPVRYVVVLVHSWFFNCG
ncbi:hypothetical protein SESBI_03807 [Sesbania bispinosa]|nr:hypothetical protein SESBI_03807 [Sesbania bispinosa]